MTASFANADHLFSGFTRSKLGERLLRGTEYVVVKGQFVAPGKHRLLLAGGLSAGLLAGRSAMNLATGVHQDGTPMPDGEVIAPLRPFNGIMRYNAYADDPRNRWKHVIDTMAPGLAGAAGVVLASRYSFKKGLNTAKIAEEIAQGLKKGKSTFEGIHAAISENQAKAIERFTAGASLKGSASGSNMTPAGYGPWLSALFGLRADRKAFMGTGKWGEFFNGTTASSPYGHAGNMRELWKHMLGNPTAGIDELHELENLGAGVAKGLLSTRDPVVIQQCVRHFAQKSQLVMRALRGETYAATGELALSERMIAAIEKARPSIKFDQKGAPKFTKELIEVLAEESWGDLLKLGIRHRAIDMRSAEAVQASLRTGDNGLIGQMAEMFDRSKKVRNDILRSHFARQVYHDHYAFARDEAKIANLGAEIAEKDITAHMPEKVTHKPRAALLTAAAAFAGLGAYGAWHGAPGKEKTQPDLGDRVANIANGVPLHTAEWAGKAFNFPPSLHRLENALGLSAGMYGGMKLGEVLAGMNHLAGREVLKEELFAPLRPLHGLMKYDFHSITPGNRWMKIAHYSFPAIGGFIGAKLGSDIYFSKRRHALSRPEYIDDYSAKIAYDQSTPWSYLSAGAALVNVGTGLAFLPFNYGMNLGTRFTLGQDRKVILPGLKEVWSNNHSKEPFGPARLRDHLIEYVTRNPDREPERIADYCRGILEPWFGPQPGSVVQRFADDILSVRNAYYRDGGVPASEKAACEKALQAHFKGQGLHDELAHLGKDVLDARLADNGLSGDIGNWLGARGKVDHDIADFRQKELARRKTTSSTDIPIAAEAATRFSERFKQDRDHPASPTFH